MSTIHEKKMWRYDTVIEALLELIEHGDEPLLAWEKQINYFKHKKDEAHQEHRKQLEINQIQVKDIELVTNNH